MIDTKKIKNKHGFTLVEIIVVLVILAILAAVAIPSVLGYVDEAKKQVLYKKHMVFMKQRKLLLQNAMQQMKMNLKNNQFFKYNYTLPADFPYKKTTNKSSWKSV